MDEGSSEFRNLMRKCDEDSREIGDSNRKDEKDSRNIVDLKREVEKLRSELERLTARINEHEQDNEEQGPPRIGLNETPSAKAGELDTGSPQTRFVEEVPADSDEDTETEYDDLMKFEDDCNLVHTIITARMGMELEKLISTLRTEESTYKENVWRDGPYHLLLAANLKFVDFTPDEWNISLSRMDQDTKASSLTSKQIELLNRLEGILLTILAEVKTPGASKSSR